MPPPKTIIVDPTRILVSIHDVVQAWISGIEAELATTPLYLRVVLDRELASARSGWITYDLPTFSGRNDLTESEKQIWRRAARQLVGDELLERNGRRIRLTTKGRARVKELLAI